MTMTADRLDVEAVRWFPGKETGLTTRSFPDARRDVVHWKLNPTMTGDTIILTVQRSLDGLLHRRPDEPKVVHNSGSQFVSRDWRSFVNNVGDRDIRTRVAQPQSNGVVERVHRTHRQESLLGEATEDYHAAPGAFTRHGAFYNHHRPYTSLRYVPPAAYYRGDPEAKLRERQRRLATARQARQAFWADRSTHPHGADPYHKSSVKCLASTRAIQSPTINWRPDRCIIRVSIFGNNTTQFRNLREVTLDVCCVPAPTATP